ncbi:hypothetical protein [Bernardetia sp.]|uniref:hypothetical protein n=1 Tax=Bernardetia sp. TaxID=1937974 RepID=UPI0025C02E22|nr:hypothetical protein [Bernardetia sp.]
MKTKYSKYFQYALVASLMAFTSTLLTSCGSSEQVVKSPVDNYTKQLDGYKTYSVILHDMDLKENTFSSDEYKHQYKFILPAKDTTGGKVVRDSLSGWVNVSESVFDKNLDNMGMELVSKSEDGKVSKIPSPPGYNNYVGNTRYGSWQTNSSGNSFWAFYGQYAFMSSMFGMMSRPIYRSSYNDYYRNYRGSRPYYGTTTSGKRAYGTGSATSNAMNSKSRFKSNVASKVSRSGSSGYSRSSSSRSSRSSGSSSRSRSSSRGGK